MRRNTAPAPWGANGTPGAGARQIGAAGRPSWSILRPLVPGLALGALLGGCGACEPDPAPPPSDASVASASASAMTNAAVAASALAAAIGGSRAAALPCRAIAVDGEVRLDGDAGMDLRRQEAIAPDRWLSLSRNARLVAKDPRTARESTFRGPGRVRACVDAEEESWIAGGTFESAAGAGETPGAEEWVVTPIAVARFGAAKLSVDATSHGSVSVVVAEGVAFLWVAQDASSGPDGGLGASAVDEGWVRVARSRVTLVPLAGRSPFEAARSAVNVCSAIGQSARDLANALLAGDGGGVTAARQVTTRRLARAACAVAALRVEMLPTADTKASLSAPLKDAAALWRALPLLH